METPARGRGVRGVAPGAGRTRLPGSWVILAAAVLGADAVAAQSLEREMASIDEGWATLVVEVREGVRVCDHGIRWADEDGGWRGSWRADGRPEQCDPGPLQLDFRLRDGAVRDIEAGRVTPRSGARELTARDPIEVSDYLVSLAYHGASADAAEEGLFLSRLPRGADPTEGILRVAQDRELPSKVRKSGLFWAGQLASEVVVAPLRAVAVEEDEMQEVREAAVFALSQHQGDAATPALMELALEAPHPGTRKSAMFWLAQRDDPEVADFLADVIMGRRGG